MMLLLVQMDILVLTKWLPPDTSPSSKKFEIYQKRLLQPGLRPGPHRSPNLLPGLGAIGSDKEDKKRRKREGKERLKGKGREEMEGDWLPKGLAGSTPSVKCGCPPASIVGWLRAYI